VKNKMTNIEYHCGACQSGNCSKEKYEIPKYIKQYIENSENLSSDYWNG